MIALWLLGVEESQLLDPSILADPFIFIFFVAILFLAFYVFGGFVNRWRVSTLASAIMNQLISSGSKVERKGTSATACVLSGRGLGRLEEYSILVGVVSFSNPLTWLTSKLAGRRDLAILRAKLPKEPPFEVTLVRKDTPAQKHAKWWGGKVQAVNDFLVVTSQDSPAPAEFEILLAPLRRAGDILLLSFSKTLPHIQAYLSLPEGGGRIGEALRSIQLILGNLEKL